MMNPEFLSRRTLIKVALATGIVTGGGLSVDGINKLTHVSSTASDTNPCVSYVNTGETITIEQLQEREKANDCKITLDQTNTINYSREIGVGLGMILLSAYFSALALEKKK
jgi:hypothetical protein